MIGIVTVVEKGRMTITVEDEEELEETQSWQEVCAKAQLDVRMGCCEVAYKSIRRANVVE